jgi:TPR repeat protein
MKQHLEETPRPPSELRPELADWPGVDGLAMRLLAKNRDDRPQDAELLGLLDDLLYGSGQARPEPASEQRQERPATIIEEEWRRPGAVPTPLPQRVSLYPSQHLTQPPLQPPSPPPVSVPKPATRKFPGWAWGALGLLALAAVVAAGWFFVPHPQPRQTPAAVGQPAASPAQAQNVDQHEPQLSVAEEPKSAPATQAEAKPAAKAAAEKPASPPAGKPAQTNVPSPSAQKPEPSPTPPVAPPAVQKPSGAEMERQAASLYKAGRASEAATLFDQACSAGSREACANLGVMYASGKGVAKIDDARAAALYATACNLGDATGCNNLGNIYAFGRGVSKDYGEAASLYAKACAAGSAVGCSNLGNYYRLGFGVEKDPAKARQFLTKGCGMGNQWGCDRLKEMQ